MAAGAVVTGRVEAGTGGADEAVLVERENGPRPSLVRGRECAPTECWQQVVAVDHTGAGAPHSIGDLG